MYNSQIATDIKIAMIVVADIMEAYDAEMVKRPCKLVLKELMEELKTMAPAEEIEFEISPLFRLYRTRVILNLIRDVNRTGKNDINIETNFSFVQGMVDGKIALMKGNENEKHVRG